MKKAAGHGLRRLIQALAARDQLALILSLIHFENDDTRV